MDIFIWFLIAVVLIAIIFPKENRDRMKRSAADTTSLVYEQTVVKNANIEKIKDLLSKKDEVTNHEVKELLNVSARSVVRYMDVLEKQKVVEQVGGTGTGVVYRRIV